MSEQHLFSEAVLALLGIGALLGGFIHMFEAGQSGAQGIAREDKGATYGAALVAVALIAGLSAPPLALAHVSGPEAANSPRAAAAPYDVQFLDTMAQHHRDGIEMFQMAADKAQKAEVRKIAERMIREQQQEIPELNRLREQIGPSLPQAINMKLPGMKPMDMTKLEQASGRSFDHSFLDMTIAHHRGALAMAGAAVKRAGSSDVREKAQAIIDKQSAEIGELQKLRQGRGLGSWRFSRRRRKTFSTPMIASSTSSPMAMESPPSVMVLMERPAQ